MPTPEEEARQLIDDRLAASGWIIQTYKQMNLAAGAGLAVTEFPGAHGPSDYLLYVEGKALGVVEANPAGYTLKGVEGQSAAYADGLAVKLPAWRRPLPFQYETTGAVTQFTNWMEPHARSRDLFSFHRPETLLDMAQEPTTVRGCLLQMPEVAVEGLWPKQHTAIVNLEKSLRLGKPRSLIQMATGSGKTFTAANTSYRLIRHARARRVLFLVDRTNLGDQTLKEFQQFQPSGERHTFDKLYNIAFPRKNNFDPVNRVIITTIQRLYSVLTRQPELAEEDEERSSFEGPAPFKKPPVPITYNPALPPEFFDVIIIDECHRSIYSVWGDVLRYFDAFLIGLTATPSKQTIGFFNQNLVMEYTHAQAVADRVNVPYDVYEIDTRITNQGSQVDAGYFVGKRSRKTRAERQEELDSDLIYDSNQLDRAVVAEDQIRTIIQTFRDRLFTEIFPGRTEVPKTIIFGKDDSHADDIVRIIREEFGRGNDFCQKITYRTGTMPPKGWRERYPQPAAPKTDGLVELPEGWCWATIDQLLIEELCNGISVKGSDTPPGIAALKLNAISDHGFDYSAIRYLPIDADTAADNSVHAGDFYVSRGNGSLRLLARGVVAQQPPFVVVFPDTMIRIRLSPSAFWIPAIWPSHLVRSQIERMAKTTAGIYKISQSDLESFILPLPPQAEQTAIVEAVQEKLSQIDALEGEVDHGLARAGRLRQAILKAAFEGKLVAQDANDEPAAALLERLRASRESASTTGKPKRAAQAKKR